MLTLCDAAGFFILSQSREFAHLRRGKLNMTAAAATRFGLWSAMPCGAAAVRALTR